MYALFLHFCSTILLLPGLACLLLIHDLLHLAQTQIIITDMHNRTTDPNLAQAKTYPYPNPKLTP